MERERGGGEREREREREVNTLRQKGMKKYHTVIDMK